MILNYEGEGHIYKKGVPIFFMDRKDLAVKISECVLQILVSVLNFGIDLGIYNTQFLIPLLSHVFWTPFSYVSSEIRFLKDILGLSFDQQNYIKAVKNRVIPP